MKRDEVVLSLREFKAMNGEKYSILKIGFFGSAARDEITEKSDIDIIVELTEPDLFKLIGIKQDLETQFARHVDIVRYRRKMNPFLKSRIDKEAVYV
ncbi:MAG: nucleotidyltransferase domain-containing protein [Pseudomonadota bacterium]